MRGHLKERSPSRWSIVLNTHDSNTGKRKPRWHSFKGTKREAQKECARLIAELQTGAAVEPSRRTVAAFLDQWLTHMKPLVAPRTHERYSELVRNNIAPLLGSVILAKLAPITGLDRLCEGSRQRPQERQRRAFPANRASHAPHPQTGAATGRALADAEPQSG